MTTVCDHFTAPPSAAARGRTQSTEFTGLKRHQTGPQRTARRVRTGRRQRPTLNARKRRARSRFSGVSATEATGCVACQEGWGGEKEGEDGEKEGEDGEKNYRQRIRSPKNIIDLGCLLKEGQSNFVVVIRCREGCGGIGAGDGVCITSCASGVTKVVAVRKNPPHTRC